MAGPVAAKLAAEALSAAARSRSFRLAAAGLLVGGVMAAIAGAKVAADSVEEVKRKVSDPVGTLKGWIGL